MKTSENYPEHPKFLGHTSEVALLQAVIDNFMDGILILTEQGEWVQVNEVARKICARFPAAQSQPNTVPKEIWSVCQSLLESGHFYTNQTAALEAEIELEPTTRLRIRVKWLKLWLHSQAYLLVMLEDRKQSVENIAITEVDKYGLTAREAEVWCLYRGNYTYKEIAAELHISLNTVKKHMKNIHAKQDTVLHMEDYRRSRSRLTDVS
ncbi:MAG: LuxR C-terminal-related transcriptional regulator [Leptolyngbyaceae cyanobacterium MO_188.B28]|nr:LuxR C-terminal-related transcriptional regulator [Leptolyngbyaceae cyanobacterium MO_188.B28]